MTPSYNHPLPPLPPLQHTQSPVSSPIEPTTPRHESLHDLVHPDQPKLMRPSIELVFHGFQAIVSVYALCTILKTISFQISQSYFSGTAWFLFLANYASLHMAVSYLVLAWWSRQPSFQDEIASTIHDQDLARQLASAPNQPLPPTLPLCPSKVTRYAVFLLSPRSRVWLLLSLVGFTMLASIVQAYKIRRGTNCTLYVDALHQFCLTTRRAVGSGFMASVLWLGWSIFWFLITFYKRSKKELKPAQEFNMTTRIRDRTSKIWTQAVEAANKNWVGPLSSGPESTMPSHHITSNNSNKATRERTSTQFRDEALPDVPIHQLQHQQQQQSQPPQQHLDTENLTPATPQNEILTASRISMRSLQAQLQLHSDPEPGSGSVLQHLDVGPPVPPKDIKGKGVVPGGMGSTRNLSSVSTERLIVDIERTVAAGTSSGTGSSSQTVLKSAYLETYSQSSKTSPMLLSPVADQSTRLRDHAKVFSRSRSTASLRDSTAALRKISQESINTISSVSTQARQMSMSRGEMGYMGNRTLKALQSPNEALTPRSTSMGNIAAYAAAATASAPPVKGSIENERHLDEQLRALRTRSYSINSLSGFHEDIFRPEAVPNSSPRPNNNNNNNSSSNNKVSSPGFLSSSVSSPALDAIRRSSIGIKNALATFVLTPDNLSESSGSSTYSLSTSESSSTLQEMNLSSPAASQSQSQSQSRSQSLGRSTFVPLTLTMDTEPLGDSPLFTPEDRQAQKEHQRIVLSFDTKGSFRPRTGSTSSSRSNNSMVTLGQSPNLPSQPDDSSIASSRPTSTITAAPFVTAKDIEDTSYAAVLTKADKEKLSKYRSGQFPYPPPPPVSPTGTSFSRAQWDSADLAAKLVTKATTAPTTDIIARTARMHDDVGKDGFRKQKPTKNILQKTGQNERRRIDNVPISIVS
ncbi:hypothetical protein BGZ83_000637 [Gryganskiella cystojenkinii]|nr:hypothetical protein BGZ83_000637 [Gryganskiella cystojenkinii]